MVSEYTSGIDGEISHAELCNWLKLMQLSGTREILLDRGSPLSVESSSEESSHTLDSLRTAAQSCMRCDLHRNRKTVVFGEGSHTTRLMFIGEGPGADEDLKGEPFVGRAGMLLTKIIEAMGLERKDVYITNVVKCRPPGNRNPEPDEIAECLCYLEKQIELIEPDVICTLGLVASQAITGLRSAISGMRGRFYDYKGIQVVPTFHPAACLRNPANKRLVWADIKKVMKLLNLPIEGVMRDGATKNKR